MSDICTLPPDACGARVPSVALMGMCYLDLDNFEQALVAVGPPATCTLQGMIGNALGQRFGADDVSAAEGAHAFLICLHDANRSNCLAQIEQVLTEIASLRVELPLGGCSVTAHAGVAWAQDHLSEQDLRRYAHAAALTARRLHLSLTVYGPQAEATEQSARLICDLMTAMDENRLQLIAQEIVRLKPNPEAGRQFEVLLQMVDRTGLAHSPSSFVPLAERSCLIEFLDHWVIRHSLLAYAPQLRAHDDISLSLNVSGRSLSSAALWPLVASTIAQAQIAPHRIQLEVTETSEIHDMEQACANVGAARAAGLSVALDDFGAGLSGYMYLKHLDVNCIKIDGALIPNVVENFSLETKIVRSVVALAHHLDLEVVAEHVSSPEILAALRHLGVDKVQGFEVGVPFPYAELFDKH